LPIVRSGIAFPAGKSSVTRAFIEYAVNYESLSGVAETDGEKYKLIL
jgi:hypothetical protein